MSQNSNSHSMTVYFGRIYTPLSRGGLLDIPHGALAIDGEGNICGVGHREEVLKSFPNSLTLDYGQYLIIPGLIDCHQHLCHYDWVRLVPNLMDWLKHIYELEIRFNDLDYSIDVSRRFFGDMLRNGTTTACVHGPYFADAAEAAFQVASEMGIRLLMGMNAADKNIPSNLYRAANNSIAEATRLYAKWHGANNGLLSYCFTVRPAYCASRELMESTAETAKRLEARLQCHLAEDTGGQQIILQMFPECKSDTEVYNYVNMLGSLTIMAHGVYLSANDCVLLSETGTSIIHCPRANLMAGGKQFDLQQSMRFNISTGLGSDLGGSKGLSMFRVMEDALKVSPDISIHDLFRMGTLDGATVLNLADSTGSLEVGKEADFLVLCPKILEGNPKITSFRIEHLLSSLVFKGDDRDVKIVVIKGKRIRY